MQQMNEKDSRGMEACGWDDDFWEEIGLGDLVEGHHAKIGILLRISFLDLILLLDLGFEKDIVSCLHG